MINKLSGIFEDGKAEAQQIINNISTVESERTWQNGAKPFKIEVIK